MIIWLKKLVINRFVLIVNSRYLFDKALTKIIQFCRALVANFTYVANMILLANIKCIDSNPGVGNYFRSRATLLLY